MKPGVSPLAKQARDQRTVELRGVQIWGACVHTTGTGVPAKAAQRGKDPMDVAVEYYLSGTANHGPHYVIGWDGLIVQVANEHNRTMHVGGLHREDYLSGKWLRMAPPLAIVQWKVKWPKKRSPQHLFPSRYPNTDYVGIEMIPIYKGKPAPAGQGLRFTEAQHDSVTKLLRDFAARSEMPVGWSLTSRLVGHEDVGLLDRCDAKGGWDPGWLRSSPYFDFQRVRRGCL